VPGALDARGARHLGYAPWEDRVLTTKLWSTLGVATLIGASGCSAATLAHTAEQTGCPSSTIEIFNEDSSFGLRTWTASCGGKTYYCSLLPPGSTAVILGSGQPSSRYSADGAACTEATEGESPPSAAPAPANPNAASAEPPKGAAGFTFKSDVDTTSKLCVDAGKSWKELPNHRYLCGGTPTDIGLRAKARLDFCDEKLCAIGLLTEPTGDTMVKWIESYARLRGAFAQKYGNNYRTLNRRPLECGRDALQGCFEEGRMYLKTMWTWPEGQSLALTLGSGGDAKILIWIVYRDGAPTEKTEREKPTEPGVPKLDAL
jgi:hypothetical protein